MTERMEMTPAMVAIAPTIGTGKGRPRIGPQTRVQSNLTNKRLLKQHKSTPRLPHAHHSHGASQGDGKICGRHKKTRKTKPGVS